jgi:hypothetical protein
MAPEPEDQTEGLWLTSEPHPDGSYIAVVSVDGDTSWTLSPPRLRKYGLAVIRAAANAEYEQALYAQLTSMDFSQENALTIVSQFRSRRPRAEPMSTTPLAFESGLSAQGMGFVKLMLNGKQIGQLDPDATRAHGAGALELLVSCELDAVYRKVLTTFAHVTDDLAVAAVSDMGRHRPNPSS